MAMMLIDQTKDTACKTAEADAIRAKTGGSTDINYDYENNKGFADAIAAIPSGGGGGSLQSGTFTLATNGKTVTLEMDDVSFTHFFAYDGNPTSPDPTAGGWKTTTMVYASDVGLSRTMSVYTSGTYYSSGSLSVSVTGNIVSLTTGYNIIAGDTFTWFAW